MVVLIGNFLSKHGFNPTAIEDLAVVLSTKYSVKISSDRNSSLLRLFDMLKCVIVNRNKCKLIIIDVFSTRAIIFVFLVVLFAKWFNIPYVPVLRGGGLPKQIKKYPSLYNFIFNEAKKIISPSKYIQQNINQNLSIEIIPNYIHLKQYNYKIRKKIKPNILWVRSIHQIYNPIMAVNVLYQIKKEYPNAKLCFVGPVKDDNLMDELVSSIDDLNLQKSITFTGYLSKLEWIELSSKYDIFINTTNYDNHPISVIEAMALGLTVISTNAGGMKNLIQKGENGLLVQKNDVNSMATNIKYLLEGKIDAHYLANNARNLIEKHDFSVIIKKWHALINSI